MINESLDMSRILPSDDDGRRLLNFFKQLRTSTTIPIILDPWAIKWIPDQIGSGESSAVTG
jgi:hypothetical protein